MRYLSSALAAALLTGAACVGAAGTASAGAPPGNPPPGTYPVVLSGDFTGDGAEDLFFHSPGSAADIMYDFDVAPAEGGGNQIVDARVFTMTGAFTPVAGDFTGDSVDDIFWYRPGVGSDVVWDFTTSATSSFVARPVSVRGTYRPVSGDFTDDGVDDIFWYGPGSSADWIWELGSSTGSLVYRNVAQTVRGTAYQPVAGKFSSIRGGSEDIFWYNPSGTESLWDYPLDASLAPTKTSAAVLQVSGTTYKLAVPDLFDDPFGYDDIVFVGPGSSPDSIWNFYQRPETIGVDKTATPEALTGNYTVAVGLDSRGEGLGDYFAYESANTRGVLHDIYLDGGNLAFDRTDFDPAPVTDPPDPAPR